jgi:cell envelope opacity-associated protein A
LLYESRRSGRTISVRSLKEPNKVTKKLVVLLSSLLLAGAAFAAPAAKKAPAKPAAHKTHIVEAEVVSVDAAAKTITVKGEQGETTSKVEGSAVAALKSLKAGEKVKLTCRDNEKGEHEAVTHIRVEKATATK